MTTPGATSFPILVVRRPVRWAPPSPRRQPRLLSSQSADIPPFTDHLEQTERAIDAIENRWLDRQLVHLYH